MSPQTSHQAATALAPCRLSYKGLGEPLSLVAFSLLSTVPAFIAIMRTTGVDLSAAVLVAAHWPLLLPVAAVGGLTTTAILFCSHFHQIEGDTAAGKRSPLVRLGTTRGCQARLRALLTTQLAGPYRRPACAERAQPCRLGLCGSVCTVAAADAPFALLQVLQVASVLTHALAFTALYTSPDTQSTAALTLLPAVAAVQMNSFAAKNHEVPAAVRPLKARAPPLSAARCPWRKAWSTRPLPCRSAVYVL